MTTPKNPEEDFQQTNDFGFTFEFPEGDESLECGIENPESCESCQ